MSEHIVYKHGVIWEVHCPVCNTLIRSMVADDNPLESELINGKVVVRERMVLACLPSYREVKMAMADGTFHIAPMCAECAGDLTLGKVTIAADKDPEGATGRKPTLAMHAANFIKD
jgi:hypothetical protein